MTMSDKPVPFYSVYIYSTINLVTILFAWFIQLFSIYKAVDFLFFVKPTLLLYLYPLILMIAGTKLKKICINYEEQELKEKRKKVIEWFDKKNDK